VVVGRSGTVASWEGSGSGSGPRLACGYYDVVAKVSESGADNVDWDGGPADPVVGGPYVLACFAGEQLVQSRITLFDPSDPLGGIAATERAIEEARRQLELPLPEPALNPPGAQLVGVPTWLWLQGTWQGASASAAVGSVTSTVTARPVQATWDLGDGTTLTCDAGTPYDPSRSAAEQDSSCTHVFTTATSRRPGGAQTISVTVSYEVSWQANTGAGGALEGVSRTTSIPIVVEEAQALIH
jgi:hypothetical protein